MQGKKTLTLKKDFARLHRSGASWAGSLLVIKALHNDLETTRYALSISKKTGGAVLRNRLRRRLREIVRSAKITGDWDILIIARPASKEAGFEELRSSLMTLLKRAELIENEELCLKTD